MVLDKVNPKTQEWRKSADQLLESLARENKYIVSDMLIVYLESVGLGLTDYSPVGGVFKRAVKKGLINRVHRPTKHALWFSRVYENLHVTEVPVLRRGQIVGFRNFGDLDNATYRIAEVIGDCLRLELYDER